MAETIQVQQRFPAPLLGAIDAHADKIGITRTGLVNMICQSFMEAIEIDKLRAENADLRKKVVSLAMERRPAPGHFQTLAPEGNSEKDCFGGSCCNCESPSCAFSGKPSNDSQ